MVLYFLPRLRASCTRACPKKDVSTQDAPAVTDVGVRKTGTGYFLKGFYHQKTPRAVTKITRVDGYPCPAASESGPGEIFCAEQRRNAQKVQKHRGEHRQSIL